VYKVEKNRKNRLTNPFGCAIICKLSTSGHAEGATTKKVFKKLLKNLLTKRKRCGIIPRLCARATADRSLKIEQQEI